jgi:hypothetical protein
MQRKPLHILCSVALYLIALSCGKNTANSCVITPGAGVDFGIYENILDTLLPADTVFEQTTVSLITNKNIHSPVWKIGDDTRIFTTSTVSLFFNTPEKIPVSLTATYADDCLQETKTVSGSFTIVKNDGSIVAPVTGTYLGYNADNPQDTFSISIRYWFGNRYSWWPHGAYSIQNLPKGYIDSTQNFNGFARPEITGIICSNGYKNIAFEKPGYLPAKGIEGYASLKRGARDTLMINYKIIDTEKLQSTGQIIYLNKQYVGIKNL